MANGITCEELKQKCIEFDTKLVKIILDLPAILTNRKKLELLVAIENWYDEKISQFPSAMDD